MKTLEIIGYKRDDFGKKHSIILRREANTPGILYGGATNIHFYTPMALLKNLVYTPEVHFVNLIIENKEYKCILQEIQFHPVSEMIMHIDMLQIASDKQIKMNIPIKIVGNSPGVIKGGNLVAKVKKVPIMALPQNMPEFVEIDISSLDIGQMVRVADVQKERYKVLKPSRLPIVSVEMSRALKSSASKDSVKAAKK